MGTRNPHAPALTPARVIVAALLAAAVLFCAIQDRVTSVGAGRYVEQQRAALAGRGAPVTVDGVMGPWISRSVRQAFAWSALPIAFGAVAASVVARRSRRA